MKNIILLLSSFFLFSCGTRKTETTKKEEKTKTDFTGFFRNSRNSEEFLQTDLNLKTNYNLSTFIQDKISIDEFTVEPIDKDKPSTYIDPKGNKHVLENAKMTNKKTDQQSTSKTENSGNSEEILKADQYKKSQELSEAEIKKKEEAERLEKNKKTEREQSSLWGYSWLIILIVFIIARKIWQKYKDKIWWV